MQVTVAGRSLNSRRVSAVTKRKCPKGQAFGATAAPPPCKAPESRSSLKALLNVDQSAGERQLLLKRPEAILSFRECSVTKIRESRRVRS